MPGRARDTRVTTSATTLEIVFHEWAEREPLHRVAQLLTNVQALMLVGYWIRTRQESYPNSMQPDPRASLQEDLRVGRLSYNSPLSVVLEISPYAVSCIASARGVVYLMNRWEDWRVKHARANYEAEAWRLLRHELPKNLPAPTHASGAPVKLPTDGEINVASKVLPRIQSVSLDEKQA